MKTQEPPKTVIGFAFFISLVSFLFSACGNSFSTSYDTNNNNNASSNEWLIPKDEVVDGGPGRDGIPSIDSPKFTQVDQIDYVLDERRVIGVKIGDQVKAYPHQIMDWHEIVNDEINNVPLALTYCPLTNTAIGWNREINGEITEFGVSGLLFRNNLIPFDRNTDSEWSQMQMRSVAGANKGKSIEMIDVVETTWKTWKKMYPESQVLTNETGFSRDYSSFEPYGQNYLTDNNQFLFPVKNKDERLEAKERVHGIFDGPMKNPRVIVFPIEEMGLNIKTINKNFRGTELVVVGSNGLDFMASFKRTLDDDAMLNFEPVQNELPVVMEDQEGNKWNVFGEAVSGPRLGQKLTPVNSYTGFWFAWADFFPDNLAIHQAD